jgi:hypothetical protein
MKLPQTKLPAVVDCDTNKLCKLKFVKYTDCFIIMFIFNSSLMN